ncbi:MAG: hypothetical protein ACPG7F_07980 [Aggregatilineales bacterium]
MNGLENEYAAQVNFRIFNAKDNAEGESLFSQMAMRGHPGIIIYDGNAQEVYRSIGVVNEDVLKAHLTEVLQGA